MLPLNSRATKRSTPVVPEFPAHSSPIIMGMNAPREVSVFPPHKHLASCSKTADRHAIAVWGEPSALHGWRTLPLKTVTCHFSQAHSLYKSQATLVTLGSSDIFQSEYSLVIFLEIFKWLQLPRQLLHQHRHLSSSILGFLSVHHDFQEIGCQQQSFWNQPSFLSFY